MKWGTNTLYYTFHYKVIQNCDSLRKKWISEIPLGTMQLSTYFLRKVNEQFNSLVYFDDLAISRNESIEDGKYNWETKD